MAAVKIVHHWFAVIGCDIVVQLLGEMI
jgi:hypothetical protein